MQKFCPKCYAQSFDETAFYCYKCGTILLEHIPEKKKVISQSYRIQVSDKESMYTSKASPFLQKSVSIPSSNPIEICAHCGEQIIDINMIFCKKCGAYTQEVLSGDESFIVKHSLLKPLDKTSKIDQNSEVKKIKEQEPALMRNVNHSFNSTENELRLIFILAGIAILFFIFMFTFLIVFN